MIDELGDTAEKVIKFAMLVEHDMGRFFVNELEEALKKVKNGDEKSKLDVIANAVSYTNLLHRHIDKEDNVVYTFAQRGLSEDTMNKINEEFIIFENEMSDKKIQETYINLLEELEKKYLV